MTLLCWTFWLSGRDNKQHSSPTWKAMTFSLSIHSSTTCVPITHSPMAVVWSVIYQLSQVKYFTSCINDFAKSYSALWPQLNPSKMEFIWSLHPGTWANYCNQCVCLSVSPLACMKNHMFKYYKIFSVLHMAMAWSSSGDIKYFRFCGWRHVFT